MDKNTKKSIIELIERSEPLPLEYERELFPTTKKEIELKYAGKERDETILNDTMSVPFQAVKHFGKIGNGEWANMLIFGDNLQALKHLLKLKEEGKLKNPDGSDGIKLIYIDPPFATQQDFEGSKEQKAYSDKIADAEFLEFLRKRLIILKDLLTDDGSIFVHLDYRTVHYIKILIDEVFDKNNLVNEIIWAYRIQGISRSSYARKHNTILWYSKTSKFIFEKERERNPYEKPFIDTKVDTPQINLSEKEKSNLIELIKNEKIFPDKYKDILFNKYYSDVLVRDVWDCDYTKPFISGSLEYVGYPTQKPEGLLARILKNSTKDGDIVLDCFAGSGTAGAVAEKLGRKWIMVDSGKLAIYTIQKRMMDLKEDIGNVTGKPLKHKPFVLYHAGLYNDGELLQQMKSDEYKDFVLELFSCQKGDHKINGMSMQGTLNNYSVMVFDKENFLTYEFIDDLHKIVGSSIKDQLYLIAPVGVVGFNEDYVIRGKIKYVVLRIPNSIIEMIKDKKFTKLKQPRSVSDINHTIDAVGFDFVYPPKVKTRYYTENPKGKLIDREYVIEIEEFEPVQLGMNVVEFKDSRAESLATVMIDFNYNGEIFNLSKHAFGDQITKDDFRLTWDEEIGDKIMIIYIDIFGNEKREVISKKDFARR